MRLGGIDHVRSAAPLTGEGSTIEVENFRRCRISNPEIYYPYLVGMRWGVILVHPATEYLQTRKGSICLL